MICTFLYAKALPANITFTVTRLAAADTIKMPLVTNIKGAKIQTHPLPGCVTEICRLSNIEIFVGNIATSLGSYFTIINQRKNLSNINFLLSADSLRTRMTTSI